MKSLYLERDRVTSLQILLYAILKKKTRRCTPPLLKTKYFAIQRPLQLFFLWQRSLMEHNFTQFRCSSAFVKHSNLVIEILVYIFFIYFIILMQVILIIQNNSSLDCLTYTHFINSLFQHSKVNRYKYTWRCRKEKRSKNKLIPNA